MCFRSLCTLLLFRITLFSNSCRSAFSSKSSSFGKTAKRMKWIVRRKKTEFSKIRNYIKNIFLYPKTMSREGSF